MELSKKPSITSNNVVLGFLLLRFGVIFEDKTVYVPFVFLCRIDILRSTHRGNCVFSGWKMDTFLCMGRKSERKKRVSAGCGNGVQTAFRFSTVSIAAAREKRGRGFLAQAACRRSFALPYYEQKSIRNGLLVLSKFLSGVDTIDLHAERTPDAVLKNAS